MLNVALRDELLVMQQADLDTRRALIDRGELFDGYHPEMAAVHQANNARLGEIIDAIGWPTRSLVGDEASEAAWKIAQHAILNRDLQEQCLSLLEEAVKQGESPAWQLAMLTDRVLVEAGKPQRYGSILIAGDDGLEPHPIEAPIEVEDRRREMGLPPLAEHLATLRAKAAIEKRVQGAASFRASPDSMDRVIGSYRVSNGQTASIYRDGDDLMGQMGEQRPVQLLAESDTTYLIREVYGVIIFELNRSGKAVGFTLTFENQTLLGTRY